MKSGACGCKKREKELVDKLNELLRLHRPVFRRRLPNRIIRLAVEATQWNELPEKDLKNVRGRWIYAVAVTGDAFLFGAELDDPGVGFRVATTDPPFEFEVDENDSVWHVGDGTNAGVLYLLWNSADEKTEPRCG